MYIGMLLYIYTFFKEEIQTRFNLISAQFVKKIEQSSKADENWFSNKHSYFWSFAIGQAAWPVYHEYAN